MTAKITHRAADPELPAGRPARLPGRQQLGFGPHDVRGHGARDFEFIYENTPAGGTTVTRNEAADKIGGVPADAPLTYWVKLISDGSTLRAGIQATTASTFDPVGRPANISGWAAPQVGPVALSDARRRPYPVARFDWIRFNPDSSGGGGGGGG